MKEVFGSMALDDSKIYTFEDIDALPGDVLAELIDGQIYYMAHPMTLHQILCRELFAAIYNYIAQKGGDCQVFPSPFGVYLDAKTNTFVLPDITVVCDPSKIDSRGCHGAPDWVIEIISPSSRRMDYMLKLFKYRSAGVREYWAVDSEKQRITVWNFEKDAMDEYSFSDTVPAGIYEDFSIDFSKLNLRIGSGKEDSD